MLEGRPAPIVPATVSRRRVLVPLPAPRAPAVPGRGELWLAAHFPRLPLDALLPGTRQARAAIVTAPDDPRRTVIACNERAARQGIAPGMGLNAALARVPGLRVEERRPAAEAALLDRLGRWALQFTPVVSLEPPGAVLAEVRGSLDLFGGAMALVRRALAGLSANGLAASLALAPTPRAALWLARADLATTVTRSDALPGLASRLPLACLHWPEDTVTTLTGLGIASVADLLRLPRTGFAARFGPQLLDELDEGLGRRPAPRRRHVVPERFDERLELPAAAESGAVLQPALEHGLARLEAFLRARASGIHALRVDLLHRGHAPTRLTLSLARMAGDAAELRTLLRERLGRCRLGRPWSRSGCALACCCRSSSATLGSSSAAAARIRRRRRACSISCAPGSGATRCSAYRRFLSTAPSALSGSRSRVTRPACRCPGPSRARHVRCGCSRSLSRSTTGRGRSSPDRNASRPAGGTGTT